LRACRTASQDKKERRQQKIYVNESWVFLAIDENLTQKRALSQRFEKVRVRVNEFLFQSNPSPNASHLNRKNEIEWHARSKFEIFAPFQLLLRKSYIKSTQTTRMTVRLTDRYVKLSRRVFKVLW